MTVAIVITVFRNPPKLACLLDNIREMGKPDVPLYVFEDPSPWMDAPAVTKDYAHVINIEKKGLVDDFKTAPTWGCMQGIIQFALENTKEDWIIYVPDDVLFTKGGLWNELAGILTYGREFVGAIQAPYWNSEDLVRAGVLLHKDAMYTSLPTTLGRNIHWEGNGLPRVYINVNGAGFSLNRRLFEKFERWPTYTWRLDEWVGFQAWKNGFVCLTLPGPPRVHCLGGSTKEMPGDLKFAGEDKWKLATGMSPSESGIFTRRIMEQIPENWDDLLDFFKRGGRLKVAA